MTVLRTSMQKRDCFAGTSTGDSKQAGPGLGVAAAANVVQVSAVHSELRPSWRRLGKGHTCAGKQWAARVKQEHVPRSSWGGARNKKHVFTSSGPSYSKNCPVFLVTVGSAKLLDPIYSGILKATLILYNLNINQVRQDKWKIFSVLLLRIF